MLAMAFPENVFKLFIFNCSVSSPFSIRPTCRNQVSRALDDTFQAWHRRYCEAYKTGGNEAVKEAEEIFSDLLHHSAYPTSDFLQKLAHGSKHGWERFGKLVLLSVESAKNPLVPGMRLSVALAEAAERAREGGERRLSDIRNNLDDYMKEIFERLPQTVRGLSNGICECSSLFEPEGLRTNPVARLGPLQLAFGRRQHMEDLCDIPLVMDYLSNKFTCGLPDIGDKKGILSNKEELDIFARSGDDPTNPSLFIGNTEHETFWVRVFQGITVDERNPAIKVLPGAQFAILGLLTKPRSYYRVPVMRMAMDFVVYAVMLVAYYNWVLLYEDGPVTLGEVLFACYVLAGVYTEWQELKRDFHMYLQDRWNYLDTLGFAMLLGGFCVRLSDSESSWGRGMYALSAPPVFSRVLFFAQMLKFQGPMIQAMFSMAEVLLKFGVILAVVVMSFASSFYALFRDVDSFYKTLLNLFMTMLGDVELFDELEESSREQYTTVGRLLLVIFIIVVTIMLLNLLIAILSTVHAEVHSNMEREFKVSTARTIQHYRLVVELDTLPAPFNALQTLVVLPYIATGKQQSHSCRRVKRAVGHVVFWLTLGPVAMVSGVILWFTSFLQVISIINNQQENDPSEPLVTYCCFFLFYLGGPLFLVVMWLKEPLMWIMRVFEFLWKGSTSIVERQILDVDVQKMLEDTGVSASNLRKYLENPMIDPDVRRDEVDRTTTVEHVKLLRDHLKEESQIHFDKLHETLQTLSANAERRASETFTSIECNVSKLRDEIITTTDGRVSEFRNEMNERFASADSKVSELRDEINEKFVKIVEILQDANRSF